MTQDIKIKIRGRLDKTREYWFAGMTISYEDDNTIFSGPVKDDAQLHGILNLIRDLNLKLLSVHSLTEEQEQKD